MKYGYVAVAVVNAAKGTVEGGAEPRRSHAVAVVKEIRRVKTTVDTGLNYAGTRSPENLRMISKRQSVPQKSQSFRGVTKTSDRRDRRQLALVVRAVAQLSMRAATSGGTADAPFSGTASSMS